MSSLITEIHLTPDELRVICSALSTAIITMFDDGSVDIDEQIEVYKSLHAISESKWPGWLMTNSKLKEILEERSFIEQMDNENEAKRDFIANGGSPELTGF